MYNESEKIAVNFAVEFVFFFSLFGNAQNIGSFSYFNRSKYLQSRNVWISGVRLTLFFMGKSVKIQ